VKGYGDSEAPAPAPDSSNYSKRALAVESVALMRALGHERFSVVGHDRGARIAYRMAFDHPDRVAKLVVLDIVPTGARWASVTRGFALNTFHWGFLAQGGGMPERLIGGDPDCWLEFVCRKWGRDLARLEDAMPAYRRAFARPEVIAATCADYRAGATLDDEHDRADLAAGRRIACPTLAIWSGSYVGRGEAADPLEVWRRYAVDVRGFAVDCGHFIPEEAPEAIAEPIEAFLTG
jgi:haloacetate dehalogenase